MRWQPYVGPYSKGDVAVGAAWFLTLLAALALAGLKLGGVL